ncbi:MAG TPA: hypothetical protein VN457_01785, partial [Chlamydiales bacterium]|nr:hypothetical protein [Chlamydiales bacterium]
MSQFFQMRQFFHTLLLIPFFVGASLSGATLYVTNLTTNQVFPITVPGNTIGAPIPVGTLPASVVLTSDNATAVVVNAGSDNVTFINTATNSVITTLATGGAPQTAAITPDDQFVYVVN